MLILHSPNQYENVMEDKGFKVQATVHFKDKKRKEVVMGKIKSFDCP